MEEKTSIEKILTLAKRFIDTPSTADNLAAIEEAVTHIGNELADFTVETFFTQGKPSLLIHNQPRGTKAFKIIFNAHIDVVPGESEQYKAVEKDGKLYGRGAYDMKAATAVMLTVFRELAPTVPYPMALQITSDEETGCLSAKEQVEKGVRAEFVISGECGSNFMITNKAKGVCQIKLTAKGETSHGAYPWKGDNAIIKMHKAIATILKVYPHPEEESYNTTVNVTRIFTNNQTTNKTPDFCEAYLDVRYIPEDKDIFEKISTLLPEDVSAEEIMKVVPLDTDENNDYLQLLKRVSENILDQEITLRFAHGSSDIVRFAEVGCAGVDIGPIGANQHAANEWVDIKSLTDYYQILKQFLLAINTK